ncbi:host cell division inhibitor Icd-like protein [Pseudescherichia sp.]|uniref:host cell division inhibitor Icd-like protein n=1 Tax=Pseudescherichia sp. TaxID=2055881 RepID=UPI00289D1BD9|nr:host cell division inhibitor Icd-like protein [Pseudescherichia sp.]
MVDIWLTPDYLGLVVKCMTDVYQKATPQTVSAVLGRLTKPLSEVTIMAELQHTQTQPKFTWRFLALSSIGCNVVHIPASTEREAREQSPDGCVMVFAGRLPVQEVRHA